jgi:hypothetical protein
MICTKPIARPSTSAINCSRNGSKRNSSVSQPQSSLGLELTTAGS